ncbi:MAG: inositol monophosphatase [Anaerolineae bacterium]|nr:inositol monophosphatase [Anaerolineae bacterium]
MNATSSHSARALQIPIHQLEAIRAQAVAIARGAGAILREGLRQIEARREGVMVRYKSSDADPVTEFDHLSEAFIVEALQRTFPGHRIVGEEGGRYESKLKVAASSQGAAGGLASAHSTLDPQFEWQVDPLDGTVNFAHGFPVFAVSLGLLIGGTPVIGVVYNPISDELFSAVREQGATLNDKPIRVSRTHPLSRALLNTGFPYDRYTSDDNNFAHFLAFQRRAQGVRRVGSAALDLCTVACGRMDGYWELKIQPHDIAAGIVIVREAGGVVTDFDGGHEMFARGQAVASNGLIHQEMLDVLHGR